MGKDSANFKNLHESKSLNSVVIFIGYVVNKLGNKNNIKAISKRSLDLVLVRKANFKLDFFFISQTLNTHGPSQV